MGCVTCNWTPVGLTHRFMGFCMGRPWVAHGSPMVHPWVAHDGTPTDEINVSKAQKTAHKKNGKCASWVEGGG